MSAKIRIAFQGGGAKFLAMLPVAHAFSVSQSPDLQISAVAGTSAGAICAALVAAGCDFERLRDHLKAEGREYIKNLVDSDAINAIETARHLQRNGISISDLANGKKRKSMRSAAAFANQIYREGRTILNERVFGNFVEKMLTFCNHGDSSIEDLHPNLFITVTSILESRGIILREGKLAPALRASCGLPILFRSFNNLRTDPFVDGGISNNLPVDCLRDDPSIPVFAVFPEENVDRSDPSNLVLYILEVLSAGINHNVERAKAAVDPAFHFSVKTNYSTFDFEKALTAYVDDNFYKIEFEKAKLRIQNFVNSYGQAPDSSYFRFIDARDINDYVKCIDAITNDYVDHILHNRSCTIVRVNCAKRIASGHAQREADTITRKVAFTVVDPKFRYYRSTVSISSAGAIPTVWHARNASKNKNLPIRVLSIDDGQGINFRRCIIEFENPQMHIAVGDQIELSDVASREDAMIKMNRGESDDFEVTNHYQITLDTVENILIFPKVLGSYVMEFDREMSSIGHEEIVVEEYDEPFNGLNRVLVAKARQIAPGNVFYCRIFKRG